MNQTPSGLSVSKALVGFLNTKAAEGLSPRTLQNYEHLLWPKTIIHLKSPVNTLSVMNPRVCSRSVKYNLRGSERYLSSR